MPSPRQYIAKYLPRILKWLEKYVGLGGTPHDTTTPPTSPPAGGDPIPPGRPIKASFLLDNAAIRTINILSPQWDRTRVESVAKRCKDNGDTHMVVGLLNDGDRGFEPSRPVLNPYVTRIGGPTNPAVIELMDERLNYLAERFTLIPQFFTDDGDGWTKSASRDAQIAHIRFCISRWGELFGRDILLALEAEETFAFDRIASLARWVKDQYKDRYIIGLHHLPRQYAWSRDIRAVDVCYYQMGFQDWSLEQTKTMMRGVVEAVKKPVVCWEYSKSSDSDEARAVGEAALTVDEVIGYGNGGR